MASTSTAFRQLTDGNQVGTCFGQSSTDIICFYGGATSGVAVGGTSFIGANAATCVALAVNTTSGSAGTTWAFGSSTQANAVIGLLDWAIRAGIVR